MTFVDELRAAGFSDTEIEREITYEKIRGIRMKDATTQELTTAVESELKEKTLTIIQRAKIVKITSQESYDLAASLLADEIKPIRKRWNDYWRGSDKQSGPLSLAYRAYDSLMEKFNQGEKPLKEAEDSVSMAIRRWDAEQMRLREERQRQAQFKAEEDARVEAAKQAEFAEMAGASEQEVEAIANAPVAVVAAPVEPTYERRPGLTRSLSWKGKVTDIKKLCAAIGKGIAPTNFVEPNQTAINSRANSDRSTMNIPGVIAYDPNLTGRQ